MSEIDHISDPSLRAAVYYARNLIGQGESRDVACSTAARLYHVAAGRVALYIGEVRLQRRRSDQLD